MQEGVDDWDSEDDAALALVLEDPGKPRVTCSSPASLKFLPFFLAPPVAMVKCKCNFPTAAVET
jgi:hypothetical protein